MFISKCRYFTLRSLSSLNKNWCPHIYINTHKLYISGYGGFVHNYPKLKSIQMSFSGWTDKQLRHMYLMNTAQQ
jgi:hypothetical protein